MSNLIKTTKDGRQVTLIITSARFGQFELAIAGQKLGGSFVKLQKPAGELTHMAGSTHPGQPKVGLTDSDVAKIRALGQESKMTWENSAEGKAILAKECAHQATLDNYEDNYLTTINAMTLNGKTF